MNNTILTIITYTISNENQSKSFTDFLEKNCQACKVADQSTYVSPFDRENIIQQISLKNFEFGKDDHVTLYYCEDMNSSVRSLPLIEYTIANKI